MDRRGAIGKASHGMGRSVSRTRPELAVAVSYRQVWKERACGWIPSAGDWAHRASGSTLTGRKAVMRTFDLFDIEEESNGDTGFVVYWKAANTLYDIVLESEPLFHKREAKGRLTALAIRALRPIITLREAQIPERYWHPDIMNWLLFTSYQNPNYTVTYLLALYDTHIRSSRSMVEKLKAQNAAARYEHTVRKLLKY